MDVMSYYSNGEIMKAKDIDISLAEDLKIKSRSIIVDSTKIYNLIVITVTVSNIIALEYTKDIFDMTYSDL